MSKKEKKSFDIIVYAMMIVAVIYAIVQSLLGNNQALHFKITLGIWILAAVVLSDFVEPMVNKEFDNMGEAELKKFLPYAITDAGAYICIYMFVVNAGMYKEPSPLPVLFPSVLLQEHFQSLLFSWSHHENCSITFL